MNTVRHKWSGKLIGSVHDFKGGAIVQCLKCGCTKERIRGKIEYFINDTYYQKSPKCKPNQL